MIAKNKSVLCYVTDRTQLRAGQTIQQAAQAAILAGVDWIQIREKDLPAPQLFELVRDLLATASGTPVRILVNDRLDAALASGGHGIHLGTESLPAADVVRWLRQSHSAEGWLTGVSCHSVEEVRRAEAAGVSYIFLGPIFPTPSKIRFGPSLGLDVLEEACRAVAIPVLAIGGVTRANQPQCLAAGAAGIAAIRMFQP